MSVLAVWNCLYVGLVPWDCLCVGPDAWELPEDDGGTGLGEGGYRLQSGRAVTGLGEKSLGRGE